MNSKFKIAVFLLFSLFEMLELRAQAPSKINYQAVARNTETGKELSNQPVFVVVKILENESNGAIVYQENHPDVLTNRFGLFTIAIGGGEVVSGSFENINWQDGAYWLQIDMDAGAGMETVGAMQFVSVPYALHAETVTNANDADADPENELVTGLIFDPGDNNLSLFQQGTTLTQNLSSLVNDSDADPENELVTSFDYDSLTSVLSITQAGGTLSQNLTSLLNDADADPENEAIMTFSLVGTNLILQEAQNWTVNLSQLVNDADADPENELITNLELISDTILKITEAGEIHELNLGVLNEDNDWKISDDGTIISNLGERVGIGTSNPSSTFEVNGSVGYSVKILNNLIGSSTYNVTDMDHIIVCKVSPPNSSVITINMPPAATCEGREIIIRKTGIGPTYPDVNINFGSDLLDFINDDTQLTEDKETVIFISLGSDGWTRILKN